MYALYLAKDYLLDDKAPLCLQFSKTSRAVSHVFWNNLSSDVNFTGLNIIVVILIF